ncbi:capsid decoration protein [Escherichia phage vB_EcoS_fFiEco02]|uniref:capsid decoration protein n=1 Tax=Escherichia phage vB_EcoS_fFiEco02 TaxID=2762426 RepID=UPI00185FBF9C|nr:capsid decoration protein [Escherichia phage vB_EcoS_fFiEco02]QNO11572.1 capsid decoration protein [Escherichia phage vB_EcoS_fFiEco02]
MVDVIKRRITGVSADTVGAKIDMANISPASFSSALAATTSVTTGGTMTLTVTGGLEPCSYQWYKNNNTIDGATAATYAKASTTTADSGTYKVVVHDVYGNIISSSTVATVS